jgi:protein-S-isoprenylcysteine O-methyltransferase Ste14
LERQSLPSRVLTLFFFLVALMLFNARFHWVPLQRQVLPQLPGVGVLADVVVFLGLLVALWARAVLGRNWSGRVTFKQDHELIQRGPYRWVRHPIYSGLLLMVSGTALGINRANVFLGLVICAGAIWVKIRQEEALMTRHFPEAYPQYKARTKALIPFVL